MAANVHVFQGPMIRGMLDEAKAEGQAKGEAKGVAKSLLKSLELRGIPVSDEQRERITACADEQLLERWFERSFAPNATANEIFADG